MTKDKIPYLIILILIVVSTFLYFRGNPKPNNIPVYKHQIDSLQTKIDSLNNNSTLLYDTISVLWIKIDGYNKQIIDLNNKLKYEKNKTQEMVNAVDGWSDNDIEWFFANRYKGFFPDSITNPRSKISH